MIMFFFVYMQLLFNYVSLCFECPGREASPKEERHISTKKECSLLAGGVLDFFPVIILLMSSGAKNYLFDCTYVLKPFWGKRVPPKIV